MTHIAVLHCLVKKEQDSQLTLMGTEAIFAIFIKVVRGGAPQEAIVTALRCTAVVLSAHEKEGESTELSISIAELCLHHCQDEYGSYSY